MLVSSKNWAVKASPDHLLLPLCTDHWSWYSMMNNLSSYIKELRKTPWVQNDEQGSTYKTDFPFRKVFCCWFIFSGKAERTIAATCDVTTTTATVVNTHNAFSGFVGSLCRLDVDRFILICSLTSFLPFFFLYSRPEWWARTVAAQSRWATNGAGCHACWHRGLYQVMRRTVICWFYLLLIMSFGCVREKGNLSLLRSK